MKKGLKRTIAGSLIFILAVIIPVFSMTAGFMKLASTDAQSFVVPGTAEVRADEPGSYFLWNDYMTTHEGVAYNSSQQLPEDLVITVKDEEGVELVLEESATISVNNMSHAKQSIAYVIITDPGTYTVTVEGSGESRVFSWSPFNAEKVLKDVFKGVGFAMVFGFGGLGLAVWGIVVLCTQDKKAAKAA